jgi:hypothetical protein
MMGHLCKLAKSPLKSAVYQPVHRLPGSLLGHLSPLEAMLSVSYGYFRAADNVLRSLMQLSASQAKGFLLPDDDLGRRLRESARVRIPERCPIHGPTLEVISRWRPWRSSLRDRDEGPGSVASEGIGQTPAHSIAA